ncbi:MAG: hypothetical protein RML94_05640 [Bacteroidia bacterium]|nr:hypothetical protein [Bacteroidia bacterium]
MPRGWAGGGVAPKRSAARSTPTRAQRGTRPKIELFFRFNK